MNICTRKDSEEKQKIEERKDWNALGEKQQSEIEDERNKKRKIWHFDTISTAMTRTAAAPPLLFLTFLLSQIHGKLFELR